MRDQMFNCTRRVLSVSAPLPVLDRTQPCVTGEHNADGVDSL